MLYYLNIQQIIINLDNKASSCINVYGQVQTLLRLVGVGAFALIALFWQY
jgi:hypothetical protein